ncbi:cytochrome P450 [soil metagenome]
MSQDVLQEAIPTLAADPYADEVLKNPLPFYAEVREAGPVVFFEKYGVYGTGRHAEVAEVLGNYKKFSTRSGIGLGDIRDPASGARPPSILAETDPPAHTATRSVATKILSPRVTRQFRELFEKKAVKYVDRILSMKQFDGIQDLWEPYLFEGFPEAMGIAFDDEAIRSIGYMAFNQTGPKNALYYDGLKVGEPYIDWFAAACQPDSVRPGSLADDFFKAEAAGDLPPNTASNIIRTFVRAGTDTTKSGMGTVLRLLASDPRQWATLKSEPNLARTAFDEALRCESPVHVIYRTTTTDVELAGHALKDNTKIAVFPGSANRDERKWENPDLFDVRRRSAGIHMSFGTADHTCIGQNLARVETECLLNEMIRRVAKVTLIGTPEYLLMNQLRMLKRLPLEVEAV